MAVVVGGVRVVVHDVSSGEDAAGQVRVACLDPGVEHGDHVGRSLLDAPRVTDAHPVQRVLPTGLRIIDPDRGDRPAAVDLVGNRAARGLVVGQREDEVGFGVLDGRIGLELGDDRVDRLALRGHDAGDGHSLAGGTDLGHDAEPLGARDLGPTFGVPPADDDFSRNDLGGRRRGGRLRIVGSGRGECGAEQDEERQDGCGGSGHAMGTPVHFGWAEAGARGPPSRL
jgi:hypothetical protein